MYRIRCMTGNQLILLTDYKDDVREVSRSRSLVAIGSCWNQGMPYLKAIGPLPVIPVCNYLFSWSSKLGLCFLIKSKNAAQLKSQSANILRPRFDGAYCSDMGTLTNKNVFRVANFKYVKLSVN